jgi:hypothetical protein
MNKVTFVGLSKYDSDFIATVMEKHHTNDPEKALKKEGISFERLTPKDYDKLDKMKRLCGYYVKEGVCKYTYLDGEKIVIFVSDRRCTCACQ